jgi:2-C-methyl-D-erythritol 4-phosphate cytidylyltransferase
MDKFAIIVAGGSGTRMGSSVPKQYLEIGGRPILMHTLEAFHRSENGIELILVIPSTDFEFWDKLCLEYGFNIQHQVVAGGNSRFQSVKNGLNAITTNGGLVAIHDGVRPFVKEEVIKDSFVMAEKYGSAIAVVPLKDSLRKLADNGNSYFQERQFFRLVQTPQTFRIDKIKKAFEAQELQHFTDDATVYEHQGWQVHLISGNTENIKITTPEDMDYASFLIDKKNS